ncbi:cell division protein DedD [Rhodococcus sp. P27]|nr:cell division protein DedD [Rhodococcus sp. P27]
MIDRPEWDAYFLGIARSVAARSDCERSQVGAVVVNDRRIRSTGYNGSPAGKPGCLTCPRRTSTVAPGTDYNSGPGRCVALHAEQNAIIYANREDLQGASLYVTRAPCPECSKLIGGTGVTEVIWPEGRITL